MHRRSPLSLHKLFFRHPFQRSPIPRSPFSLNHLPILSNQSKKFHYFHSTTGSNPSTQFRISRNLQHYSVDATKEVDMINLKFAEAREEIEAALESKETVYFDEEALCAREAVKEVVDMYDGLLAKLPDNERSAIQRAMGLKIEQLKAEVEQLND